MLLVDNRSGDGTCQYVLTAFPWARLICCARRGSGHARNAGVEEAIGSLILSTDADCVVAPDWIERLVTLFQTLPADVAAVGGRILPMSTKTAVERYAKSWVQQPDASREDAPRYAATPNAAFRSSCLKSVGAYDGTLGFDDADLGIRLGAAGFQIRYTDAATVYHRNPIGIVELYRHKVKYGKHNFDLSRKHPALLGWPTGGKVLRALLKATIRRVLGDICVKQPLALVSRLEGGTRMWPLIDAVIAISSYRGFSKAASLARAAKCLAQAKPGGQRTGNK
ncbi:glycosyltransferase family 2 protein [Acidipila sp. EB88]|uniref:glycosyltransferase n=1 Tax=Acidipila sp. EB88 TaxID=2305226 RepID=UPI003512FF69